MPEEKELKQQDVFSYIDRELRSGSGVKEGVIRQETRPNFRLALVVDLMAVMMAALAIFGIYTVFENQSSQLVDTQDSIKGLEDVLYEELQKRASSELTAAQAELLEIQAQLEDMEGTMAEAQAEMEAELAEKQAELASEYESLLANASEEERAKLEEEYADQQASLEAELQAAANEMLSSYQSEYDALLASQTENESALAEAQADLEEAQSDYEAKLAEQAEESSAEIAELEAELLNFEESLAEMEAKEDFLFQINALYQGAISSYEKGKYDDARTKLQSVLTLYDTGNDGYLTPSEEEVDRFFVEVISDYLTLKASGVADEGDLAAESLEYMELMVTELAGVNDLADNLESGLYDEKASAVSSKIADFEQNLPEVYALLLAYGAYLERTMEIDVPVQADTDTQDSLSDYNAAVSVFNSGNYAASYAAFSDMIDTYPNSDYVDDALSYMESIYSASADAALAAQAVDEDAIWDEARTYYEDVYETQYEGYEDLAALKEEQNTLAQGSYESLLGFKETGNFVASLVMLETMIEDYPLSDYTLDAVRLMSEIYEISLPESTVAVTNFVTQTESNASAEMTAQNTVLVTNVVENTVIVTNRIEERVTNFIEVSEPTYDLDALKAEQTASSVAAFESALAEYESGDYDEAFSAFKRVIESYPLSDKVNESLSYLDLILAEKNQNASSGVSVEELRSEQTANAESAYLEAVALFESGETDAAKEAFRDVVMDYPLSDYTQDAIDYFEAIYENKIASIEPDVEIQEVTVTQTLPVDTNELLLALGRIQSESALPIFESASLSLSNADFSSAVTGFSEILLSYPLSEYQTAAVSNLAILADFDTLISTQTEDSEKLFTQGVEKFDDGKFSAAYDKFTKMIVSYPLSTHLEESISYIDQIMKETIVEEAVIDTNGILTFMSEQQTADSESLYTEAKALFDSGSYEDAEEYFISLMKDYPLSGYGEDAAEKLLEISDLLVAEAYDRAIPEKMTYMSETTGQVTGKIGMEIYIDLNADESVEVGDEIWIYRRSDVINVEFIGKAEVTSVSTFVSKAKMTESEDTPQSGDIFFKVDW